MEMNLLLLTSKSISRKRRKSFVISHKGRFTLSTTHAFEISIRDGSKFDDTLISYIVENGWDNKKRPKHLIFIAASKLRIADGSGFVKGATKLYFTHYSCVVIILLNTGLCRSAFSTISLRN